jgi:transcriptional regulator with XRE-family HTH domain
MKDDGFDIELGKLGERIRKIRKAKALTLVDLQLLSGIHDTDLSRIERGLDNIEFLTVYKIAKGLDLATKELLDYDGALPDSTNTKKVSDRSKRSSKGKKKRP